MITFKEDTHQYFNQQGEEYLSVTTFVHQFEPKKDWDVITQKYIDKRTLQELIRDISMKYGIPPWEVATVFNKEGVNPKTVQYFWNLEKDRACKEGSDFHQSQEDKEIELNNAVPDTVSGFTKNLYDLEDGVYTELTIWNDKHKICGKSDKVIIETIDGVRYVDIEDFKTNKELKINYNYISKNGLSVVNEYMEPPLSYLVNCNYNHYNIQLSMYAYMLECFGYVVRNLILLHTTDYSEETLRPYELKYMKKEVEKIFSVRYASLSIL